MQKFAPPIAVAALLLFHSAPANSSEALKCAQIVAVEDRARCLERLISSGKDLPSAYFQRGIVHLQRGNSDLGLADFNRAIRFGSPNWAAPYAWRGLALWRQGLHDRALGDLNKAIELKADWDRLYGFRGELHLEMKEYGKAIADLSKAIQLYSGGNESRTEMERWRAKLEQSKNGLKVALQTTPAKDPVVAAPRPVEPTKSHQPYKTSGLRRKRLALVIANSAYSAIEPLTNPANDARAVAAALRRLGFAEVDERYNLSLADMVDALKGFGDKSASADWSIVYYAGHGIEFGGTTYLIPTDARVRRDVHVPDEAVPLDRVLAKVEAARHLRLVILDACRNNPFAGRMARAHGTTRSVGRGLARIEPEGGVIVAYAAKHGTTAQDGPAAHSPFTEALLQYLEEPGLEINFLFRKVRDRVLQRTGGAQEPFFYGSLGSEPLYFKQ
jgi:tetratricopeptide (TPR) repeat protein